MYMKLYTHLIIKEDGHTLYGFVEKSEREIFKMLLSVSGIGASIARTMLSSLEPKQIPITPREKEILELVVEEYTNLEIAAKLFISTKTVDAHKRNLIAKTRAKNVVGLVLFAIEHQLVSSSRPK